MNITLVWKAYWRKALIFGCEVVNGIENAKTEIMMNTAELGTFIVFLLHTWFGLLFTFWYL